MKQLPSFRLLTPFLAGTLFLLGTLPAAAQLPAELSDPSSDVETPTFGEIIDVRVINLEVVVTEGRERVMGLGSEDFRLLVDGREVPIEYFTEVVGGQAVAPSAGSEGAIPALAPGAAVGTRFLVFIDDSFTVRGRRNRVLRKLSEQLQFLGPDDRMAVVAFDGYEIDLLTSWTGSQRALERVFQTARERRAHGLQRRVQMAGFLPSRSPFLAGFGGFAPRGSYYDAYRAYGPLYSGVPRGSRIFDDSGRVIDAATSVLRAFARPPGRKVMLLLSGGWPTAREGGFQASVAYGNGRSNPGLLRPLADVANRLGYTLYPIDVQGVESHFGGAQYGTLGEANFAAQVSRDREWAEESGMMYLAEETGGRALLDGASLSALQRAVEDTRSYYWLGFTPTWEENDRRHRVKVEVRRKGLRVRSRESFSDLSRQTEVTMLVESSQLFDLPVPGENRELGVSFGEPAKGGFRKVIVPLRLEIPLDQVTLLPTADGPIARLELRVAVTDDEGKRADIPVVPIVLQGEPDAGKDFATFEMGLKLRRRPHKMLVSLHEPASGNLITKRVALTL